MRRGRGGCDIEDSERSFFSTSLFDGLYVDEISAAAAPRRVDSISDVFDVITDGVDEFIGICLAGDEHDVVVDELE